MYYIKFIADGGVEYNVSCYGYSIHQRDGWSFVTTTTRDSVGLFDTSYCVGDVPDDVDVFYCSMFVMNINGQTIDKIVSR